MRNWILKIAGKRIKHLDEAQDEASQVVSKTLEPK